MAQGRGNAVALALMVMVAFFAALEVASATSYPVAGSYGWQFPPNTTYYDTWSANQKFVVGDSLVFNYVVGTHDVQVAKTAAEYTGCAANGTTYSSGKDTIALDTAGTFYYICAFTLHCDQGMKMKVVVSTGAATPATSPKASPPPATPPPATPPPATPPATPPVAPPTAPPAVPPTAPPTVTPAPTPAKMAPTPTPVKAPSPPVAMEPTPAPVSGGPGPAPQQSASGALRVGFTFVVASLAVALVAILV